MLGRAYNAGSEYRYGFNGKELDQDIDPDNYDYGERIYDARLGRFLSTDPLTRSYPMLTPYQFASDRPIDGIDLDGLEFSKATSDGLRKKIAVLQTSAAVVLIPMSRGTLNGIADANSFGISDHLPKFTGLSTNNVDEYTGVEQVSYLLGIALGATLALEQSAVEIGSGGGISLTGAGAVVGAPLAVHGASVGLAAGYDLSWALAKLLTLNIDLTDNSSGSNSADGTNSQNNSAHGGSQEGGPKAQSPSPPKPKLNPEQLAQKELEKKAKKLGLNAQSENTKQLLSNFDMKAKDYIAKYRKGSINSELGELGDKTIGQVFENADSKTRKLILNGREKFKKG